MGECMQQTERGLDRTWAEISLSALRHNYQSIRKFLNASKANTKIMAIVKAEAYGHGSVVVSKELEKWGVDYVGVSLLDEAILLRKKGITLPILILSHTEVSRLEEVLAYDLTQTIYRFDDLKALSLVAQQKGSQAKVHLKVDTGMHRIGFDQEDFSLEKLAEIFSMKNLCIEGIFTHFAEADDEKSQSVDRQFSLFLEICQAIERAGYRIPLKHCANSAALLRDVRYHLDMVRPGLLLYGHSPFSSQSSLQKNFLKLELKNMMKLWTRVIQKRAYPNKVRLGYGQSYETQGNTSILTLPVGYADGYSRLLSGKIQVAIQGKLFSQVGNICMDACMVEVPFSEEEKEIYVGQRVLLFGEAPLPVEALSEKMGTLSYEILSNIGQRVPLVYTEEGHFCFARKHLFSQEEILSVKGA